MEIMEEGRRKIGHFDKPIYVLTTIDKLSARMEDGKRKKAYLHYAFGR